MASSDNVVQSIGADIGRGYVKGYTEYGKKKKEILFKSQMGDARTSVEFEDYLDPLYKTINGEEFFIGDLAEQESYNAIPNSSDDKTSMVAENLLYSLISELACTNTVKICLGVPNRAFNHTTLNEIQEKYRGAKVSVYDNIRKTTQNVYIQDINIFREADAALLYVSRNSKDKNILNKRLGMVTVGFRTTELAYFDKGLKFNDKKSKTLEVGHRTVLETIQKQLEMSMGVTKTLSEIDSDPEYTQFKDIFYRGLCEKINQTVEMTWDNHKEMSIFLGGGTSLKFNNIPKKFQAVRDAQMITARGLYLVSTES